MKRICWVLVLVLLLTVFVAGCKRTPPVDPDNGDGNGNVDPVDPDNGNGDTQEPIVPATYLAAIIGGYAVLLDKDGNVKHTVDFRDVSTLVWAPNGSRLLIHRNLNNELWIIDADGSNLKRLSADVTIDWYSNFPGYLWHPDSNRVAFSMANTPELKIYNLANDTVSTINLPGTARGPWWNPAGSVLALTTYLEVSPDDSSQDWGEPREHVMLYSVTGTQLYSRHSSTSPRWLGNLLAFGTYSVELESGYEATGSPGAVDSNGGNFRWLDDLPKALPSGRLIVSDETNIWTKPTLNGDLRLIATQDYFITYSEFSYPFVFEIAHNADKIATLELTITSEDDYGEQFGHWDLWIYDINQDDCWLLWPQVHDLYGFEFNIPHSWRTALFWSHDGEWLYVLQGDNFPYDIWRVATDGSPNNMPEKFLENCFFVASRPLP